MDKDFASKFRAGFNKSSEEEEALKMQEEAQKRARKKKEKKDGESRFAKIYKTLTGKK